MSPSVEIGAPSRTVAVPRRMPSPSFPRIDRAPVIAIGTIGIPVRIARRKPAFLNRPSFPSRDRVPSGKIRTESPFFSRRSRALRGGGFGLAGLGFGSSQPIRW